MADHHGHQDAMISEKLKLLKISFLKAEHKQAVEDVLNGKDDMALFYLFIFFNKQTLLLLLLLLLQHLQKKTTYTLTYTNILTITYSLHILFLRRKTD